MKITARIENRHGEHHVTVATNGNNQHIPIPPKAAGSGSSVNGGELLFLALATCYCNDIYREAAKREITVYEVDVEVDGEFGGEGQPARHISYRARVVADASEVEIHDLLPAYRHRGGDPEHASNRYPRDAKQNGGRLGSVGAVAKSGSRRVMILAPIKLIG